MSYIGRGTESISNVEVLDNLTFNGSASYTLQKSSTNFVPSSANNLLISISGVVQQGNFSVSGSTITFDTTVSASDTCDWILHYGTGLITIPADGTVTTVKINDGAITDAKISSSTAFDFPVSAYFGEETLTDGATIDWNLQTNQVAKVTLGGNRTLNAPTNQQAGAFYSLTIIQDGTGSRTLTFNSAYKFTGASAPTLTTTASAKDIVIFKSDGTNLLEVGRSLNIG